ncbi:PAN domain-containing protein [Archangium gephyra]|uniref:PAN domain-containing protein n=1 Tax=Archangium gephyra TaxID=48 RepID=UPI0035D458C5
MTHTKKASLLAVAGLLLGATVAYAAVTMEYDTDRMGGDYTSFDLSSADPTLCSTACDNDTSCLAYTYVKPGIQGTNARCWLKGVVPTATTSTCCISGVKQ